MNPRFKRLDDLTTEEAIEYARTGEPPELPDADTAAALKEAGYDPDSGRPLADVLDERIEARDEERKREVELDELEGLSPDDHARRLGYHDEVQG